MAEARLVARVETQGVKRSSDELNRFSTTARNAESNVVNLSKQSSLSTKALGGFGRQAGQAGIQVQQFVGQVQGGVSPMVALSQQATDLGFVLGFPLLGAVVGIGAAFGATLIPSLFHGKSATEDLEEVLTELEKTIKQTGFSTFELTEDIIKLGRASRQTAEFEIRAGIVSSLEAAALAAESFREENDLLTDGIFRSGNASRGNAQRFENLAKNLGITTRQLQRLDEAQRAAISDTSIENVTSLRDIVISIATTSTTASDEFIRFADSIQSSTKQIIDAQARTDALKNSLAGLSNLLVEVREDSLRRQIELAQEFERQSVDAEIQRVNAEIAREEDLLKRRFDLANEFRDKEEQAELDHINRIADIQRQQEENSARNQQALFNSSSQFFGALANLTSNFEGEQNSTYKALFAVSKAFAIAESIIAIQTGIAKAQELGFPANIGAIASVVASSANVISTIQGTSFNARQQGGQIRPNTPFLVGEAGPELVQFGSGGRIASNQQTKELMGGGGGNVTIINQTTGRIDQTEVQKQDNGDMVILIREVLNSEVSNPNSRFNKNLDQTRKVQRQF